jgi:hypothetical protein
MFMNAFVLHVHCKLSLICHISFLWTLAIFCPWNSCCQIIFEWQITTWRSHVPFYVWFALNPVNVLSLGSCKGSYALCNLAAFGASLWQNPQIILIMVTSKIIKTADKYSVQILNLYEQPTSMRPLISAVFHF